MSLVNFAFTSASFFVELGLARSYAFLSALVLACLRVEFKVGV